MFAVLRLRVGTLGGTPWIARPNCDDVSVASISEHIPEKVATAVAEFGASMAKLALLRSQLAGSVLTPF